MMKFSRCTFILLVAAVLLSVRETVCQQSTTDSADFRLVFRQPSDCVQSECDIFIGINTNSANSSLLDITLEGVASGYVAVGFSDTPNMPSADVVACLRNPTDNTILAMDAWNVPNLRNNMIDPLDSQDVTLINGTYISGRIFCLVTKPIAPTDNNDLNLNADLFLLYARLVGDLLDNPTNLQYHGFGLDNRGVSQTRINPVLDGREQTTSPTTTVTPEPEATTMTPEPEATTMTPEPEATTVTPEPEVTTMAEDVTQDFRLIFSVPNGCIQSECDFFAGINTNVNDSSLLDITLEGAASGYVAVGFSDTPNMFSADVVACLRDSTDNSILAVDAWNNASPVRFNIVDTLSPDDVTLLNGMAINGRIKCTVTKPIVPSDENDLNLDADLFLLYARFIGNDLQPNPNTVALQYHGGGSGNRGVSGSRINPARDGVTTMPPTDSTTMVTDGTTMATDGTMMATDSTTMATDGTTMVSDGTTIATDGTTMATDGTTMATDSTTMATDGTTMVTDGTTVATDGTTMTTDGTIMTTDGATDGTTMVTDSGHGLTANCVSISFTVFIVIAVISFFIN